METEKTPEVTETKTIEPITEVKTEIVKEEVKAEVVVSTEAAVAEEATEELFDNVSSTEAALVDASNDKDELAVTRASVAEWLTENVLRK
jgi:hypothetical protein